jgi:hypothetical protein
VAVTRHPVPDAALTDAGAIIGRVGSGKTYAAKGLAERVLANQGRIVIVDPTGVWWGLRSSADGKAAGFPVVVFGGDHADVDIGEASAGPLATTLATQNLPAIVDVSEFTHGARTRFMSAFLDALYSENRSPLALFLDEADLFAPQRPMPDQNVMFSRVEQIVRRGRVRGFRPWLITQRPAELHKSVLSQANTLIAMQLVAPQDRDAVGAWIEGQADRDQGRKVLAELPKLKKGEGYVWSPSHDVLQRVKFPAIATFDSSRTPEAGEAMPRVELAEVDKSRISAELRALEEEVAGDDPEKLKAQIKELRDQLANAGGQQAVDAARVKGHRDGYAKALHAIAPMLERVKTLASGLLETAQGAQDDIAKLPSAPAKKPAIPIESVFGVESGEVATGVARYAPAEVRPRLGSGKGEVMSTAERKVLIALAQCEQPVSRVRLSLVSTYSVTSSTFANALTALRTNGYLEGRGDDNRITPAGLKALGSYEPLPTGRALARWWVTRLDKAEAAFFDHIVSVHPKPVTKEQLAEATGYSMTSSTFANALTKLRALELITGRGEVRASEAFFK